MDAKNFIYWNFMRQYNDRNVIKFERKMQINDSLIARLGLEKDLEGHSGCVNCLEWNRRGDLLASGSDDVQIIIWDPFSYKKLKTLQSGHQGNIFSVKFLPDSNDNTIASGAADCKVRVHDLKSSETTLVCCCHMGRVKRLAVAPNAPFMFWSAAEDGLVLQYDLRQRHRCSSICNNVLINLTNQSGPNAEAKCIAINPVRPEMLAVGANDAFVRLYDRRMISLQTIKNRNEFGSRYSWERHINTPNGDNNEDNDTLLNNGYNELPVGCAKYFIAGHLLRRIESKKRFRAYASTYLSFSPDGNELLANLGSEQIYLFDVLRPSKHKYYDMNLHKNGYHKDSASSSLSTNGYPLNGTTTDTSSIIGSIPKSSTFYKKFYKTKTPLPEIVDKIKCKANEKFESKHYTFAISLYNKAIAICPRAAVLYGNRAIGYMKRKFDGDLYDALRDCQTALNIDPEYFKAHFRLVKCLYELHWNKEAFECFKSFKSKFPDHAHTESCHSLERDIEKAIYLKSESLNKTNISCNNGSNDTSMGSSQNSSNSGTNSDSIRQLLSESSANSDTLGSNSSNNSNNLYNNTSKNLSNREKEWRSLSYDYKSRFCGHCNTTTDIKEANFFGSQGQYIVAGSDDGSFFVWDKETTNIVRVMRGDDSIVNCLQPHPSSCLLATSGIDQVVRLWSPRPEDGKKDEREVENSEDAATANQKRMNSDPLEVMLANMGYRVPNILDSEDDDSDQVGLQCRTS